MRQVQTFNHVLHRHGQTNRDQRPRHRAINPLATNPKTRNGLIAMANHAMANHATANRATSETAMADHAMAVGINAITDSSNPKMVLTINRLLPMVRT